MIHVDLQPEPASFDAAVRQRGLAWLAANQIAPNAPLPQGTQLPDYWRVCLPDLRGRYRNCCAYLALRIELVEDRPSVDHFIPKSGQPALAYEWSNYRLARAPTNSRKGHHTDVLDPCAVQTGWFRLEMVTGRIYPSPVLPANTRQAVQATIDRLRLDDEPMRDLRAQHLQRYHEDHWSAADLHTHSPSSGTKPTARACCSSPLLQCHRSAIQKAGVELALQLARRKVMAHEAEAWARDGLDRWAAEHIAEPPPKGAGLYVVRGGLSVRQPRRRVYVDNSVISGCFDKELMAGSLALFAAAKRGAVTILVSEVVREELEGAPQAVQKLLEDLSSDQLEDLGAPAEARKLVDAYIDEGVLTMKSLNDARHIAIASVAGVDALVSWNQRHMVNPRRVLRYHAINRRLGYPEVPIHKPTEEALQHEEGEERV